MALNPFATTRHGLTSGGIHIVPITPDDDNDLEFVAHGIDASEDCLVKIVTLGGETIENYALHKGYNPIYVTRVWETGSTLGSAILWALWNGGETAEEEPEEEEEDDLIVAQVALGDANTGGGIFSWQNTTGGAIVVLNLLTQQDSPPTDTTDLTFNLGYVDNPTDVGTNFLSAVSFNNILNTLPFLSNPTNSLQYPFLVPTGKYITMSTNAGDADGLTGNAYIVYFEVT